VIAAWVAGTLALMTGGKDSSPRPASVQGCL
jgi:hypothetical protein